MKIIKYKLLQNKEESALDSNTEPVLIDASISCSEENLLSNLEVVKQEAYNGEYTIEDDGQPDPAEIPSQLDIIEAQVTYTAMMTDTLLEV